MDFLSGLREEEYFDQEEELWLFRNGGQCGVCTDSAMRLAAQFGGVVIGYFASDNPSAAIGEPITAGHDFAIIDERWVVDYWSWRVTDLMSNPILDLHVRSDRHMVHRLFGDTAQWSFTYPAPTPTTGRSDSLDAIQGIRAWVQRPRSAA